MTRTGGALAGLVVVAVIGNAVLTALHSPARSSAKQPVRLLASTTSSTVRQQGEAVATSETEQPVVSAPMATQKATVAVVGPASAPVVNASPSAVAATSATPPHAMVLKVPAGRTELRDSMFVEHDADSAVVHFDTEAARTRRRDKFETTVRVTLPLLYGTAADSMLAVLPEGAITGDRDLVSDVATSGVKLAIPGGGRLDLLPVTRPGRDGPLVVGYRVRVTP